MSVCVHAHAEIDEIEIEIEIEIEMDVQPLLHGTSNCERSLSIGCLSLLYKV